MDVITPASETTQQPQTEPAWTWGLSVVEALALFSSLCVALGFAFYVGFCSQLDQRILQLLSVQDFISAAVYYVLPIPIISYTYYVLLNMDFNPKYSALRHWGKILTVDPPPPKPEEADAILSLVKLARWSAVIPGAAIVFAAVDGLWLHWLPPHSPNWLFLFSALPTGIIWFIFNLRLERKASMRRGIALTGFILLGIIVMYASGSVAGGVIATATADNISVHMKDGTEVDGVLVHEVSTGVIVRRIGGTSILFIPNEEISRIELLSS